MQLLRINHDDNFIISDIQRYELCISKCILCVKNVRCMYSANELLDLQDNSIAWMRCCNVVHMLQYAIYKPRVTTFFLYRKNLFMKEKLIKTMVSSFSNSFVLFSISSNSIKFVILIMTLLKYVMYCRYAFSRST